jgi:hypothetical protein
LANIPFERYFTTLLRLRLKTYLNRKMNASDHVESLNTEEFDEEKYLAGAGSEGTGSSAKIHYSRIISLRKNTDDEYDRKQLLFLALKHAYHLDPCRITKLKVLTGFSERWIRDAVEKAQNKIDRKSSRLSMLRERRNQIWRKIEIAKQKIFHCTNPDWVLEYRVQIRRLEMAHAAVTTRIRSTSTTVSNRDIAAFTGFPRGTIDSSLLRLRKKLLRIDQKPYCIEGDSGAFACESNTDRTGELLTVA